MGNSVLITNYHNAALGMYTFRTPSLKTENRWYSACGSSCEWYWNDAEKRLIHLYGNQAAWSS